jgi:hypothetical protein
MVSFYFHYYRSLLLEDHINFSFASSHHTIVHTWNKKKRADKAHGNCAPFASDTPASSRCLLSTRLVFRAHNLHRTRGLFRDNFSVAARTHGTHTTTPPFDARRGIKRVAKPPKIRT